MLVLSIDPGIERCGYALFDKKDGSSQDFKYLSSGLIFTKKAELRERRLSQIASELRTIIRKNKPDILVLEQLFFFNNAKSVIVVAQAQGVILLVAGESHIPVHFLTPLEIKQVITGYGQSDKKSVQKMLKLTLGLDKELKQDDVADAIACGVAFCYLNPSLK